MTKIAPALLVLSLAALLASAARAEDRRYKLQDLQALDQRQAWQELIDHLADVPPSGRTADWDKIVRDACLRPEIDGDTAQYCFEPLKSVLVAHPEDTTFAWNAGQWARHHLASWAAVPFYAKALTQPGDKRCGGEDIPVALVSALDQSATEAKALVSDAQRLAFETCWPATKDAMIQALNRSPGHALTENLCGPLLKKGVLSNYQSKQCRSH